MQCHTIVSSQTLAPVRSRVFEVMDKLMKLFHSAEEMLRVSILGFDQINPFAPASGQFLRTTEVISGFAGVTTTSTESLEHDVGSPRCFLY